MNISSFKKLVEDRISETKHLSLNRGVAHAIRMKRLEANLTQSEVAAGICSISYLSKIENGKCHPENYYVREILNRMDIDIHDCLIPDFYEELEQFLLVSLYEKKEEMEELFNLVKDQEVYAAKLIQFGYYLLTDQPYRDVMEYLNAYKSYLSEFELKTFMIFASLAEMNSLNFKHAMDFLDVLLYLDEQSVVLDQWAHLLRIKCAYWMGDFVKSLYYIECFHTLSKGELNISRNFEVQVFLSLILLKKGLMTEAEEVYRSLKHHKELKNDHYYYLKGMLHFQAGDFTQATKDFLHVKKTLVSHSWLKIVECYHNLKDVEHVELYCEIISEQSMYPIHRKLAEFFYIKMTEDVFQLKDVINDTLLSQLKRTQYHEYLELIVNEMILFNRKNSRYKAIDELRSKSN